MNENTMELLPGLYGSMIDKNRTVGMCKYHKTAMTVKTMKQHGCLCKHGRQCDAFQKCEEHDFWRQHEQKKALKKEKRQMLAALC
jgi:hypothetical protein